MRNCHASYQTEMPHLSETGPESNKLRDKNYTPMSTKTVPVKLDGAKRGQAKWQI